MIKKITNFIKNETVLCVAIILTIITCFFVPIDKEYLGYFDYNTLICLFCMLVVVAGLKNTNIFETISRKMIRLFHTRRAVIMILVFGTFFLDMIVANDMSLITFLPLSYIVLHSTKNDKYLAFTFILQTIAANMGGMITPYGNPQNLYLYSYFNIETVKFFSILIKQSIIVAILLFICVLFVKNEPLEIADKQIKPVKKDDLYGYAFLFMLVILTIFRIIPYSITFIIVVLSILMFDKERFKQVDYALILTFCVFFIFSGNMARIPILKNFISTIVINHTLLAGILSCQFISNVPTAIFLSKFTNNYEQLLIAVNIGSLGLIISSLASLITLKEFLKHQPKKFWHYLLLFTLINTLFLTVLLISTIF